jgi:NADH dehydrogenase
MAMSGDDDLHHIVVVGGGAGGLELATRLGDRLARRGKARVTLVERARTHLWKPLLHEIAAGSMDVAQHEVNYLAHAHWHNFRFRFGEMIGLNRKDRAIHLAATFDDDCEEITPKRSFTYDTLVIAVGSVSNDFGTPGVRQHAIMLETPEQAARFNRKIVNACIRAHTQAQAVQPGQLHVTIIGAGATGTELSAELHQTTRAVVAYGLDKINPSKDIRITLVEGADRILPALPERVSHSTAQLLKGLDVDIRTGAKVREVSSEGVHLESGELIPSNFVVWAAGVKGPAVLSELDGLEVSRSNQLVVLPTLQTTLDPDIFAIGDCASCLNSASGRPVPPRAQAAHQQASHVFKQISRRLGNKPLQPYIYKDFGSLVSLGKYATVGSLMGFRKGNSLQIEGYFALLMYLSLYKMHQVALHGGGKVFLDTLGRLISRRTLPQIKLH